MLHRMIKLHNPRAFRTPKQARLKWNLRVGLNNNKSPRRNKPLPEAITKTIVPITMELGIIKARTHTTIAQEIITTTKRNREHTGLESTREITGSNINTRESRIETKIKQERIKEKTVIHLWSRLLRKIRLLTSLSTLRKTDEMTLLLALNLPMYLSITFMNESNLFNYLIRNERAREYKNGRMK